MVIFSGDYLRWDTGLERIASKPARDAPDVKIARDTLV
jgi:hypothetical protein